MMREIEKVVALSAAALIAGCAQQTAVETADASPVWETLADEAQFRAAVVGRTLEYANGVALVVEPDGGFSGNRAVAGRWEWLDGRFCRELTLDGRAFSYECQSVQISTDGALFRPVRDNGELGAVAEISGA